MVLPLPGTGHERSDGLLLLLKWVARMFEPKERRVPVQVTDALDTSEGCKCQLIAVR